ncbi:ABC transporter substrate-binding protein [Rheinheimera riviphila]|uniref:ABC transporter substrate-binding protein n=1 Tax=Rheinheimera riviphila TaxID=1834037 RepID=A0A437R5M3_9GAMM|nr:ABC transporter substrate-binding protein [Rheinheimera riviphila]RVU42052.1 ABC transporter substrate-binding protein [Rheinheimera riviphila]
MCRYLKLFSCILVGVSLQALAAAPIKVGMSAPFSGRAERLGLDYRAGAQLAFNQINQQGGIAGQQLELITLDDGYEPLRTVDNTRQLVFHDKVLALFGYVGTPTSNAVLPLLRHEQIPFIAPFSGADLLRQPADHFIYNFRASYAQEASAQIQYLVDQRHFKKIALLIQADEFGASVERNFLAELHKRQLKPLVISRFKRNTTDLADAVAALVAQKPDVVLTVGTYQVLIDAIELGATQGFNPLYSVVSFTGVSELTSLLDPRQQVLASMVMPDPNQSKLALVDAYRQQSLAQTVSKAALLPAMAQAKPRLSDVALEGFAAATVLVGALKQCAATMTRQCVLQALPQQQLYDFQLQYDVQRHQASQQVSLMWLRQQGLQPVSD